MSKVSDRGRNMPLVFGTLEIAKCHKLGNFCILGEFNSPQGVNVTETIMTEILEHYKDRYKILKIPNNHHYDK